MRPNRFLLLAVCPLLACGGKVIFDTSSTGTGGVGGAPSTTNVSGSTSQSTVGDVSSDTGMGVVATSVGTTVGTSVASTVTTGAGTCTDPGAPNGSMDGIADCNKGPCANSPCAQVCSAIYDCGRAICGSPGAQLCPGFADNPINHDSFVMGGMQGCMQQCQQTPAIKQIINAGDCQNTISTLKNISPDFANVCQGALGGP